MEREATGVGLDRHGADFLAELAVLTFQTAVELCCVKRPSTFSVIDQSLLRKFATQRCKGEGQKRSQTWIQLHSNMTRFRMGIDLEDLLANSSIGSGNLNVNSAAAADVDSNADIPSATVVNAETLSASGSDAPGGKFVKPPLNAFMRDLLDKHGPTECIGWSVRKWALNLEPHWGSRPAISQISLQPTYLELKAVKEAARLQLVEKMTVKDASGKRRSNRY